MANMNPPAPFSAAKTAWATLEVASVGSLATLTPDGAPFATLVLLATDGGGDIVLLLSRLAAHTRNIAADRRASLLVTAQGGEAGDPLAAARVTLVGEVDGDVDGDGRARFLERHPEAARYAGFADFGFYRLRIVSAHLVAGFGRIADLKRADIIDAGRQSDGGRTASARPLGGR